MSATEDYLSFYSHLIDFAPMSLLSLFLLGMFRLAPIVVFAPFLGAKLPSGVKMGLLISLTTVLLPHIVMTSKTAVGFDPLFIGYAFKEFFIGAALAFLVSIPFFIAQSAGALVDFQRGASSLQVTDPFSQAQTSSIGMLYNYMLIVIFFYINGPFIFFDGLFQSYSIVPADGFMNASFFTAKQPFWQLITALLTKVTALSIQFAAPSLLSILMTEVFLGIANRLAPQVQIVFLGMSLKSLIGLALLCAAWLFILAQMEKQTLLWLKDIDRIIFTFHG